MTVLERMAGWLVARPDPQLSQTTRKRLGVHLLDTVGAWIAGSATEEGANLSRLKPSAEKSVTLLGNDPLDQITLGVATTRLTEIDDIHMASGTTPSSVLVPTALVLAAHLKQRDSDSFAHALYAGYEVMTQFAAAAGCPELSNRGIWPSYLAAPVGAAAVTARLLGLDACKTADALAIALTMTSGAPGAPLGLTMRWLLLGIAARSGCAAGLAAGEGYAGDRSLLDDDWMMRTHGIGCDGASLFTSGQSEDAVSELSLKPYCAAKQSIAAMEALRNLLGQGVSPDDIEILRVAVPPQCVALIGHHRAAQGRIPRITSAAFNLALIAYRADGLADVSRPDLTNDPQIAAFMERVQVVADQELGQYYPARWPARVDAVLKSGRTVSSTVLDAWGDPTRALNISEVLHKFHYLSDPVISRAAAAQLAEACLAATEGDEALAEVCDWTDSQTTRFSAAAGHGEL